MLSYMSGVAALICISTADPGVSVSAPARLSGPPLKPDGRTVPTPVTDAPNESASNVLPVPKLMTLPVIDPPVFTLTNVFVTDTVLTAGRVTTPLLVATKLLGPERLV